MLTWRLWRELNRLTPLTALYYRLHIRRTFIEQSEFSLHASFFELTDHCLIFIFCVRFLLFNKFPTLAYSAGE
jgi:hypothetical protein